MKYDFHALFELSPGLLSQELTENINVLIETSSMQSTGHL